MVGLHSGCGARVYLGQNEVHARLHMVPVLGNIKLDRLNALKVQCLYCVKLDEGLSMGTVR